jgi:hypothetical protein
MLEVMVAAVAVIGSHAVRILQEDRSLTSDTRARAWATIAMIHDRSIRNIEWDDKIDALRSDGSVFDYVKHRSRLDEFGNMRVQGVQRLVTDPESGTVAENEIMISVMDGVATWYRSENDSAVVAGEDRALIDTNLMPGLLYGLGRTLDPTEMRSRGELMLADPAMKIISEVAEQVVVGYSVHVFGRVYFHRVTIDPRWGLITKHEVVNPTWGFSFATYSVLEWQDIGEFKLPRRTEYRVADPLLSDDLLQRAAATLREHGLDRDAMRYDDPNFSEWEVLRKRLLESTGGVPPSTRVDIQSAVTTVYSVNQVRDRDWLEFGRTKKPLVIMNAAVEMRSRELSLDPKHLLSAERK